MSTVLGFTAPDSMIYRFLDVDGDGTGSINAAVNGSSTAVDFFCLPETTEVFVIERMIIHAEDNVFFQAGGYGGISGTALTNGITVEVKDAGGNTILDLLGGAPITSNADWTRFCFDQSYLDYGTGSTNKALVNRWTFGRSGNPLVLDGLRKHKLEVLIQDDLSTMIDHTFQIQGYKITR